MTAAINSHKPLRESPTTACCMGSTEARSAPG
jgi:hypothetical protein